MVFCHQNGKKIEQYCIIFSFLNKIILFYSNYGRYGWSQDTKDHKLYDSRATWFCFLLALDSMQMKTIAAGVHTHGIKSRK